MCEPHGPPSSSSTRQHNNSRWKTEHTHAILDVKIWTAPSCPTAAIGFQQTSRSPGVHREKQVRIFNPLRKRQMQSSLFLMIFSNCCGRCSVLLARSSFFFSLYQGTDECPPCPDGELSYNAHALCSPCDTNETCPLGPNGELCSSLGTCFVGVCSCM